MSSHILFSLIIRLQENHISCILFHTTEAPVKKNLIRAFLLHKQQSLEQERSVSFEFLMMKCYKVDLEYIKCFAYMYCT